MWVRSKGSAVFEQQALESNVFFFSFNFFCVADIVFLLRVYTVLPLRFIAVVIIVVTNVMFCSRGI